MKKFLLNKKEYYDDGMELFEKSGQEGIGKLEILTFFGKKNFIKT